MLEHVHIAETNLQTTEEYGTDLHMEMWKENILEWQIKNGTVLHIEMLMEKSWRLEQGIIYGCYVYPDTEVF